MSPSTQSFSIEANRVTIISSYETPKSGFLDSHRTPYRDCVCRLSNNFAPGWPQWLFERCFLKGASEKGAPKRDANQPRLQIFRTTGPILCQLRGPNGCPKGAPKRMHPKRARPKGAQTSVRKRCAQKGAPQTRSVQNGGAQQRGDRNGCAPKGCGKIRGVQQGGRCGAAERPPRGAAERPPRCAAERTPPGAAERPV